MSVKIKAWLAAAAVAFGAGGVTLYEAMQSEAPGRGISRADWRQFCMQHSDGANAKTVFVATNAPELPPAAYDGRVIGDCSGGTCKIADGAPAGECVIEYQYELGTAVGGWRLYRVDTPHPYIAGALKGWVQSKGAGWRWYGGWGELKAGCLAHLTGPQCRDLLGPMVPCWRLSSGSLCRFGRLYGPGEGGGAACDATADAGANPLPCAVTFGEDVDAVAAQTWSDEDLGL